MKYYFFVLLITLLFMGCKEYLFKEEEDHSSKIIVTAKTYKFSDNATIELDVLREYDTKLFQKYPNTKRFTQSGIINNLYISNIKGKLGLVDGNQIMIVEPIYNEILDNKKGIVFKKDSLWLFYDTNLQELGSIKAMKLWNAPKTHYIGMISKNEYSLYNSNGNRVSDIAFSRKPILPISETYFLGYDDEWLAYDMKGKQILSDNIANISLKLLQNAKVGIQGYGPLKLGMIKRDVETVIGKELVADYLGEECQTFTFGDDFLNIHLLFETGVLSRIYFFDEGINTISNIGINTLIETMEHTYRGKIESKANKYSVKGGRDYLFVPRDKKDKMYRINFFGEDGVIKHYSVGLLPAVLYVEGCL